MRRLAVTLLLPACLGIALSGMPDWGWAEGSDEMPAVTGWEDEFAFVGSQVPLAMSLSGEELRNLVKRCEALRPSIETLEETPRKVYLKRLEKMKALFLFVMETQKNQPP